MILRITKHAQDRMCAMAVNKEMIKEAIKRGAKFKQTEGYLVKYTYFAVALKIIGKDGDRTIYKIKTVTPSEK